MQNFYKPKKVIGFIISSIIVITLFATLKFYKRPIPVEQSFDYGIMVKENKILNDNIKIRLNGNLSKSNFISKESKFEQDLIGTINIDGTAYKLSASNSGNVTDNLF